MCSLSSNIYKIVSRASYQEALERGVYTHESLYKEGFIHFSFKNQILEVARKHFAQETDLILMEVDAGALVKPMVAEDLKNKGVLYPHVYGDVNLSAIVQVFPFEKDNRGEFLLPEGLI